MQMKNRIHAKSQAALAALFVSGLVLSACSTTGVSEEQASSPAPSESASASTPAPSESAAPAAPASGGPCKPSAAVGSQPKDVGAPNDVLPAKSYTFNLKTNCGDIEITADAVKAPITVSTLAFLAKGGFYNGTICHRLTTQGLFVLQCGDPTATGGGGPNFTFKDENLPAQADNNYPAGSVAMANSGPNTNGSQFFLVYADTTLGANYTLWGKITKGLDIVKSIAEYGTADGSGDGAPKATVEIINASVK
jgi:peptidyl-prolyl cis-trans isomerase B (cyclophilin B)